MYRKYHTKAFVLYGVNVGSADRRYALFTRDLGLVIAHAKSARELRSKLRFALQDFSESKISLVRGKDIWRITNAEITHNIYSTFSDNREKLYLAARILSLLRRLIQGEESNSALFDVVSDGFNYLKSPDLKDNDLKNLECLMVFRMLNTLGYIGGERKSSDFLVPEIDFGNTLPRVTGARRFMISQINQALEASQM